MGKGLLGIRMFRAALVASFLGLATGCGTSIHTAQSVGQDSAAPSDAGLPSEVGTDDLADGNSAAKCGNTPRVLVDYVPEVPDAGRQAVGVPDIAVNGTDLYYALDWNEGIPVGMNGALFRIPLAGGTAVRLASIAGGGNGLLATPTGAIVAEPQDAGADTIVSIPAAGGSGTVLATAKGQVQALVTDGQNVYFSDMEATKSVPLAGGTVRTVAGAAISLSVSDGTLYLADFDGGTISSVPTAGGTVTVLATNQVRPEDAMRCGPNLCWLKFESAFQISLMQMAPGGTPVTLAGGFSEVYDLAFDGRNFFITSGAGGLALDRIPADGGAATTVASEVGIAGIALDSTCLYWSSLKGISALALSAADVAGSTDQ